MPPTCLDMELSSLSALWAFGPVLRVGQAQEWHGCALERRILKGRFPGRPRFLLEVGVRVIFLCALGLGVGVVTMATQHRTPTSPTFSPRGLRGWGWIMD